MKIVILCKYMKMELQNFRIIDFCLKHFCGFGIDFLYLYARVTDKKEYN